MITTMAIMMLRMAMEVKEIWWYLSSLSLVSERGNSLVNVVSMVNGSENSLRWRADEVNAEGDIYPHCRWCPRAAPRWPRTDDRWGGCSPPRASCPRVGAGRLDGHPAHNGAFIRDTEWSWVMMTDDGRQRIRANAIRNCNKCALLRPCWPFRRITTRYGLFFPRSDDSFKERTCIK